jgi:hypothetical protein
METNAMASYVDYFERHWWMFFRLQLFFGGDILVERQMQ